MGFRDLSLSCALGNEGYRSPSISSTDPGNAYLVHVRHTAALHQKSGPVDEARSVVSQKHKLLQSCAN